jgi:predicted transposase/invertase (TIGR01784 family)
MQVNNQVHYIKRILFYNDKLYVEQLQTGEAFGNINKSISVSILNFNLLENEIDIHNVYRYSNVKSFNQLTDIKELHFIELKKFDKNKPRYLMTKFEKQYK